MKFGKTYEKALKEQGIPQNWIDNSIQYKPLKKTINRVVIEMDKIGLTHEYIDLNRVELYYTFDEDSDHTKLKPSLRVDHSNDASNRQKIEIFNNNDKTEKIIVSDSENPNVNSYDDGNDELNIIKSSNLINHDDQQESQEKWVLSNDEVFFNSLYSQYQLLNKFNQTEQNTILLKIQDLSAIIKELTFNSKHKNDMYLWREIFNQYIDYKLDLNAKFSLQNLNAFMAHINEIKILEKFKHTKKNSAIFKEFYSLNLELIKYLSFENLNQIALRKIIKKFDKHTLLKSSKNLNQLLFSHKPAPKLSTSSIEQIIGTSIVKIIPQLEDYTCSICFNLAYKPVRLSCKHFFCLRCTVKLQRELEEKCPICRKKVVLLADESNIDYELVQVMKENFPKEMKRKKSINDKEVTDEIITKLYGKRVCIIM